MRKDIANLKYVFAPKSIAVMVASDNPSKLGNTILKNLVDGGYGKKIYPINPKHKKLLGLRCYGKIEDIRGKVELAIFAIPARFVPDVAESCGKKGVKGISKDLETEGKEESEKKKEKETEKKDEKKA